jgi:hypothetical protein
MKFGTIPETKLVCARERLYFGRLFAAKLIKFEIGDIERTYWQRQTSESQLFNWPTEFSRLSKCGANQAILIFFDNLFVLIN